MDVLILTHLRFAETLTANILSWWPVDLSAHHVSSTWPHLPAKTTPSHFMVKLAITILLKKLPPTKFRKTDPGFFFLKQSLLSIGFTSDSHTGCLGQMRVTPELPQPAPDVTSAIKELFIIPWDKYINHMSISILLQRPGNEIRATWLNIHFIFRGSVSSTLPSCRSITWTNLPYT